MSFIYNSVLLACIVGFISAVSLPIGSVVGLSMKPKARVTSALMAFGGGALLFALTIEIVAHAYHLVGFGPLAIGCVIGGILYELLNQCLNLHGGFFRKAATIIRHLTHLKRYRAEILLERLSRVSILQSMPPEDIATLVPHVDEMMLKEGAVVFNEGTRGDAVYLIDSGEVEITRNNKSVAKLGPGDIFGEMSLLTNNPRSASAKMLKETNLFRISQEDFYGLLMVSPLVKSAVEDLIIERSDDLARKSMVPDHVAQDWKKRASTFLKNEDFTPTTLEINQAVQKHGAATLGIWLGILLDGIPESLVIGIAVTEDLTIPWALVAGVFLANFPEAMSSSVVMWNQKYSRKNIILMWSSITLITAVGALLGNLFFQNLSSSFLAIIRGTAAGAMLTMISETMLPEAYERGGAVVGLSTLAGFLTALLIKSIS